MDDGHNLSRHRGTAKSREIVFKDEDTYHQLFQQPETVDSLNTLKGSPVQNVEEVMRCTNVQLIVRRV